MAEQLAELNKNNKIKLTRHTGISYTGSPSYSTSATSTVTISSAPYTGLYFANATSGANNGWINGMLMSQEIKNASNAYVTGVSFANKGDSVIFTTYNLQSNSFSIQCLEISD